MLMKVLLWAVSLLLVVTTEYGLNVFTHFNTDNPQGAIGLYWAWTASAAVFAGSLLIVVNLLAATTKRLSSVLVILGLAIQLLAWPLGGVSFVPTWMTVAGQGHMILFYYGTFVAVAAAARSLKRS